MQNTDDKEYGIDYSFGGQLKHYRLKAGLTKKEMVKALGIVGNRKNELSVQLYSRYENEDAQPDVDLLKKLSHILHVSADDLLGFCKDVEIQPPSPGPVTDEEVSAKELSSKEIEAVNTMYDVLEIAAIDYDTSVPHKTTLTMPDGKSIELDLSQCLSCVLHAKEQTDNLIRKPLDLMFSKYLRLNFWDKYENITYNKEKYNKVAIINLFEQYNCYFTRFSERLRDIREKKGLTQAQLAKKVGLNNNQTYNRYEMNNASPSLHTLKKLAIALDVSVNKLIGGYEPSRRDLAIDYLLKVGIVCKTQDKQKEPIMVEHYYFWDIDRRHPLEDEPFTENELCYYLHHSWEVANSFFKEEMNEIFIKTFLPFFNKQLESPTGLDKEWFDNTSATGMYLYQTDWAKTPGKPSITGVSVDALIADGPGDDEPDQEI